MTEYGVTHNRQLTEPSYNVQERKAARKKLLDEIWLRRRENYRHFMEKSAGCKQTERCYNSCTMSILWELDDPTREQITNLARMSGKPQKAILREVVKAGLKIYQQTPTKSAQAVLDLIAWAEKEHITGSATDVSTNHNTYAWEK